MVGGLAFRASGRAGAVTGVCRAAVCSCERLWLGAERRSSAIPTAATATATAAAVSTTPVIDGRRPKWRVAVRSLSRRGEPPRPSPTFRERGRGRRNGRPAARRPAPAWSVHRTAPALPGRFRRTCQAVRRQAWQGRLGGLMAGEGADRRAGRAAVKYLGARRTPEVCRSGDGVHGRDRRGRPGRPAERRGAGAARRRKGAGRGQGRPGAG